jgi:hypothetical protein
MSNEINEFDEVEVFPVGTVAREYAPYAETPCDNPTTNTTHNSADRRPRLRTAAETTSKFMVEPHRNG